MSIILNALRKSEQERQMRQTVTLDEKMLDKPEIKQNKTPAWVIALVVINIFFIAYFFWNLTNENAQKPAVQTTAFNNKQPHLSKRPNSPNAVKNSHTELQTAIKERQPKPQTILNSTTDANKAGDLTAFSHENNQAISNTAAKSARADEKLSIAKQIKKQPPKTLSNVKQPDLFNPQQRQTNSLETLSKLLKQRQQSRPEQLAKKTDKAEATELNQSINSQKDILNTKIKTPEANGQKPSQQNKNDNQDQNKLKLATNKPVRQMNSKALVENNNNVPPFLSELSHKFRRTVPEIKINVYVYSKNIKDRFIMVNMNKHIPGEDLGEGMILKEIGMNSFVVEYKNKVFQIKRK